MASNPTEYFAEKAAQLESRAGALAGLNAAYQFNLTGDTGGSWVIEIRPDKKEVRVGVEEGCQCAITMTDKDFMAMVSGGLNPQMAFMTGKLRVKGDMGLALKLQTILT